MSDPHFLSVLNFLGVLSVDPPETFECSTRDWPPAALKLVAAACNRNGAALSADEVMQLVFFLGRMQRDKEAAPR